MRVAAQRDKNVAASTPMDTFVYVVDLRTIRGRAAEPPRVASHSRVAFTRDDRLWCSRGQRV
jgi:hypothetical protein